MAIIDLCNPNTQACVDQVVFQGTFSDLRTWIQANNATYFPTGEFGSLSLDFGSAIGGTIQQIATAIRTAVQSISGFLGLSVTGSTALTIDAQSTSPSWLLIVAAIAVTLTALQLLGIDVTGTTAKLTNKTAANVGNTIGCFLGGLVGLDCTTGQIMAVAGAGLLGYLYLFSNRPGGAFGRQDIIFTTGGRRRSG